MLPRLAWHGSVTPFNGEPRGTIVPTGWEQDDSYALDKFYTRSTDAKGHTRQLRMSIPPEVMAQIAELIQSHRVPDYKTIEAFARDAIIHRLHWLGENLDDSKLKAAVQEQAAWAAAHTLEMNLEANVAHVDSLRDRIKKAIQHKDWYALHTWIQSEIMMLHTYREPYLSQVQEAIREGQAQIPPEFYRDINAPTDGSST